MISVRSIAIALTIVACFAAHPALANIIVEIDKAAQRMTVSIDGEPRWHWPVSTGRRGFDTPNGSYRAFRMEEDHYSREWDDAPMPHSIFFTKKGHAIHGSFEVRRLGLPASHGCVRLHPEHAAKLFELVRSAGVLNTTVIISGALPARNAPAVAQRGPDPVPAGRSGPAEPGPRGGRHDERRYYYDYGVGRTPYPQPQFGWPFTMQ